MYTSLLIQFTLLFVYGSSNAQEPSPPHIIIIIADDLGFNDVGFHGSNQIPTPNLDALAYSGVILNNYYVQPICTPSRAALLTGIHPIHMGLSHDVIYGPQAFGVPLGLTMMPQYLKQKGYATHMIGKWHLGMCSQEYTPPFRGFDSFVGYWTGKQDYWLHTNEEAEGWYGYDLRRNMDVIPGYVGEYSTDFIGRETVQQVLNHNTSIPLFLYMSHTATHSGNPNDKLQAPGIVLEMLSYIEDEDRRTFAGMMWKLDETVGMLMEALDEKQMLDNTIILFMSDNGGAAAGYDGNAASNWPLRGVKASLWEGGIRSAAFIWSSMITNPGRVSNEMIHIVDWLPTFLTAAGGGTATDGIDGMDVWESIVNNSPSPRTELLHNIEPVENRASVRNDEWKLLYRPLGGDAYYGTWLQPSGRNGTSIEEHWQYIYQDIRNSPAGLIVERMYPEILNNAMAVRTAAEVKCGPVPDDAIYTCNEPANPCLFNILQDPCEYYDVSDDYPDIVAFLLERLTQYNQTLVDPLNTEWYEEAHPRYWNGTWNNWLDFPSPLTTPSLE